MRVGNTSETFAVTRNGNLQIGAGPQNPGTTTMVGAGTGSMYMSSAGTGSLYMKTNGASASSTWEGFK